MRWPWRRNRPVLPSEEGFLEMAERRLNLPLEDLFLKFRDLATADMEWIDSRKVRFRRRASVVKLASLLLAATSTVILGIEQIPVRASIALPFVALVTVLGALESYFNWRSRWVLMEEAQYQLNRLRDEMDYYILSTPSSDLNRAQLDVFFEKQQGIWADVSRRWVEFRKLDTTLPGDSQLRGNFPTQP